MSDDHPLKQWAPEGLRFKCTGCGGCCTGEPGYVWLNETEIEALSTHLQLSREDFLSKYTRYADGRYSLLEVGPKYDCIFLKGKRCSVYEVRPVQCRTFPWWAENISSKEAWLEAAKTCEGINHDEAPLIDCNAIEQELEKNHS